MNAHLTQIAGLLVALTTFAEARAQQVAQVHPGRPVLANTSGGYSIPPAYVFQPGWGWRPKAATAAESYARGRASLIRAQAQYNVAMAHVRAVETETRQRKLQYYYANKETNEQYRDSVRKARVTTEDATRFAKANSPKPASPNEVNGQTGAIRWPVLLQSEQFDGCRAEIEDLFAQLATQGKLAVDQQQHLDDTADAMKDELKEMARETNPADYISAKRFIETLAFHARNAEG